MFSKNLKNARVEFSRREMKDEKSKREPKFNMMRFDKEIRKICLSHNNKIIIEESPV